MRKWISLVASATAAQATGRVVNFAIPFVVLSVHPPGEQSDAFLFLLALCFYFHGTLANSITDATVPLYAQESAGPSARAKVFWTGVLSIGVALGWLSAGSGPLDTRAVYAVAGGAMVAVGVLSAFPVAHLHIRHRFGLPGLTWLARLVPLALYWALAPDGKALPWLAAGLAAADCIRYALLRTAARAAEPTANPEPRGSDRALMRHYLGLLLATMISGLNPLIDRAIASLGAPGGLSVLDLAERLFSVVGSLSSVGLGSVTLVYLSHNRDISADSARWWRFLGLIFVWSLAWTATGAVLGELVIPELNSVWFQVSAATLDTLMWTYRALLIGLPPFLIGVVCVRELISRRELPMLAALAALSAGLNAAASLALFVRLGVPGVALATSLVYLVTAVLLLIVTRPRASFSDRQDY